MFVCVHFFKSEDATLTLLLLPEILQIFVLLTGIVRKTGATTSSSTAALH